MNMLTILLCLGDILGAIKTDVTTAQSFSSPLKPVYESEAMKVVRTGVNALVNSLPGLVKALDEVAKLHPFIGSSSDLPIGSEYLLITSQSPLERSGSSSSSI